LSIRASLGHGRNPSCPRTWCASTTMSCSRHYKSATIEAQVRASASTPHLLYAQGSTRHSPPPAAGSHLDL